MYRKITSSLNFWGKWLEKHPRQVIAGMLLCLLLSAALSFTVLRYPRPQMGSLKPPAFNAGVSPGATAEALRETIELEALLNAVAVKDSLSHKDSLLILQVARRLRELQMLKP